MKSPIDLITRRPQRVIVASMCIFGLAIWLCSQLRLDSDLLNLLPEDIPAMKTVRKLQSWSSQLEFMYLGLVRDDETSIKDLKKFADTVGAELEKSESIRPSIALGFYLSKF